MARGSCNCGGVGLEVESELSGVIVCHCSICRRTTGCGGIAVAIVDNADFRWTRGEDLIRHWRKPEHDWETWFCSRCGSPLPGTNDPARMFIPAGLITEGGGNLSVTDQIFVDSKASWDVIGDRSRQHPQAYGTHAK